MHDEVGLDYTDAVEWCLAGCQKLSAWGDGDNTWRRGMLEKGVVLLDRCYQYLYTPQRQLVSLLSILS